MSKKDPHPSRDIVSLSPTSPASPPIEDASHKSQPPPQSPSSFPSTTPETSSGPQSTSTASWNSLPPELHAKIFALLDPDTLSNAVPLVSRQWYQLSEDPVLWTRLYNEQLIPFHSRRANLPSSNKELGDLTTTPGTTSTGATTAFTVNTTTTTTTTTSTSSSNTYNTSSSTSSPSSSNTTSSQPPLSPKAFASTPSLPGSHKRLTKKQRKALKNPPPPDPNIEHSWLARRLKQGPSPKRLFFEKARMLQAWRAIGRAETSDVRSYHLKRITVIRMLPSQPRFVITGSEDSTLHMIRITPRNSALELLRVCRGHTSAINGLAVTDLLAVSASRDGSLRVWSTVKSSSSGMYGDLLHVLLPSTPSIRLATQVWRAEISPTTPVTMSAVGPNDQVGAVREARDIHPPVLPGMGVLEDPDEAAEPALDAAAAAAQQPPNVEGANAPGDIIELDADGNQVPPPAQLQPNQQPPANAQPDPPPIIVPVSLKLIGGLIFSAWHDGAVRVWNPTNGRRLLSWTGHNSNVNSMAVSDVFYSEGVIQVPNTDPRAVEKREPLPETPVVSSSSPSSSSSNSPSTSPISSPDGMRASTTLAEQNLMNQLKDPESGLRIVAPTQSELVQPQAKAGTIVERHGPNLGAPVPSGLVERLRIDVRFTVVTGGHDGFVYVWRVDTEGRALLFTAPPAPTPPAKRWFRKSKPAKTPSLASLIDEEVHGGAAAFLNYPLPPPVLLGAHQHSKAVHWVFPFQGLCSASFLKLNRNLTGRSARAVPSIPGAEFSVGSSPPGYRGLLSAEALSEREVDDLKAQIRATGTSRRHGRPGLPTKPVWFIVFASKDDRRVTVFDLHAQRVQTTLGQFSSGLNSMTVSGHFCAAHAAPGCIQVYDLRSCRRGFVLGVSGRCGPISQTIASLEMDDSKVIAVTAESSEVHVWHFTHPRAHYMVPGTRIVHRAFRSSKPLPVSFDESTLVFPAKNTGTIMDRLTSINFDVASTTPPASSRLWNWVTNTPFWFHRVPLAIILTALLLATSAVLWNMQLDETLPVDLWKFRWIAPSVPVLGALVLWVIVLLMSFTDLRTDYKPPFSVYVTMLQSLLVGGAFPILLGVKMELLDMSFPSGDSPSYDEELFESETDLNPFTHFSWLYVMSPMLLSAFIGVLRRAGTLWHCRRESKRGVRSCDYPGTIIRTVFGVYLHIVWMYALALATLTLQYGMNYTAAQVYTPVYVIHTSVSTLLIVSAIITCVYPWRQSVRFLRGWRWEWLHRLQVDRPTLTGVSLLILLVLWHTFMSGVRSLYDRIFTIDDAEGTFTGRFVPFYFILALYLAISSCLCVRVKSTWRTHRG